MQLVLPSLRATTACAPSIDPSPQNNLILSFLFSGVQHRSLLHQLLRKAKCRPRSLVIKGLPFHTGPPQLASRDLLRHFRIPSSLQWLLLHPPVPSKTIQVPTQPNLRSIYWAIQGSQLPQAAITNLLLTERPLRSLLAILANPSPLAKRAAQASRHSCAMISKIRSILTPRT